MERLVVFLVTRKAFFLWASRGVDALEPCTARPASRPGRSSPTPPHPPDRSSAAADCKFRSGQAAGVARTTRPSPTSPGQAVAPPVPNLRVCLRLGRVELPGSVSRLPPRVDRMVSQLVGQNGRLGRPESSCQNCRSPFPERLAEHLVAATGLLPNRLALDGPPSGPTRLPLARRTALRGLLPLPFAARTRLPHAPAAWARDRDSVRSAHRRASVKEHPAGVGKHRAGVDTHQASADTHAPAPRGPTRR